MAFITALAALVTGLLFWKRHRSRWWFAALTVTCGFATLAAWRAVPEGTVLARLPDQGPDEEFVTAATCQECHADQHATWHGSFHRTMTQAVTPETMLAPLVETDTTLQSRGRMVKLARAGDEFWAEMVDPDFDLAIRNGYITAENMPQEPPRVARQVVMATGSHHYQTYWVNGANGNQLWQIPWVYHLHDKKWIPAEDAFISPPDGPRKLSTWNDNCIQCHAVNGNPGLVVDQNQGRASFMSRVTDFGIACEACHGPGAKHVAFHRANKKAEESTAPSDKPDDTIVNPARLPHDRSSQVCGQCHSSFSYHSDDPLSSTSYWQNGFKYRPGDDLTELRYIHNFEDEYVQQNASLTVGYWKDGTMRLAGRDFSALDDSACYQKGEISCLSCHSMHGYEDANDQLIAQQTEDESCLQCHDSYRENIAEHTHHPIDSSGSRCVNCHMPHTSFGLLKAIRSHRIDSPRAKMTSEFGRPTACNLCHLDRSLKWTSDHLQEWFGQETTGLGVGAERVSSTLVQLLIGDAAERAVVAWSFGWDKALEASGTHWQVPFLAMLLEDPYAGVRYVAHKSLQAYPGFEDFEFDFLSAPEEHAVARQRAMDQWRASLPADIDWTGNTVLFNDEGIMIEGLVEQFMIRRDDSPIQLPE